MGATGLTVSTEFLGQGSAGLGQRLARIDVGKGRCLEAGGLAVDGRSSGNPAWLGILRCAATRGCLFPTESALVPHRMPSNGLL